MEYDLKTIEKMLKESKKQLDKLTTTTDGHDPGYESRCKICNHPNVDAITEMREQGCSFNEIRQELCPDVSLMSLSRHFSHHYVKTQRYQEQQLMEMLENIRQAYYEHPFLVDYFKNRSLRYLEVFNKEHGFCTDKFRLCPLIAASSVSNGEQTVKRITKDMINQIRDLSERYHYRLSFQEDRLEIQTTAINKCQVCINCQNTILSQRLLLLEKIITYNFLNITQEDKELYFELLNYDGDTDDFVQHLIDERNREINE